MNILFIKEQRAKAGVEGTGTHILRQCVDLQKRGIRYLVVYNKKDYLYDMMLEKGLNVQLLDFPPYGPRNLLHALTRVRTARRMFKKIVTDNEITHIVVYSPYLLQFVSRKWNVPILAYNHAAFEHGERLRYIYWGNVFKPKRLINDIYRRMVAFNYSKADKVIAVSNASAETARCVYGVDSDKIGIVPNGIERADLQCKRNVKDELGYNVQDRIVLSVGRITKAKGVEDFCNIASRLSKYDHLKFVFAGDCTNESYAKSIYDKYSKYVRFIGFRNDVFDLYKAADVFLFLSHRESFSYAALEAASFKLPVVCWNINAMKEMFEPGVSAMMFDYGDIDGVSKGISSLMNDNSMRESLARNAFEVSKRYTVTRQVDSFLKELNCYD